MSIVDWFFPRVCVGCGQVGEYICTTCLAKLTTPEPVCPMCCRPSLDGWVHTRCRLPWGMERLVVALPYRGIVQQLLKKVKYKNSWDIIAVLFEYISFHRLEPCVVSDVPMFPQKERERGFNQAKLMAQIFAKANRLLYFPTIERVRSTKPMFGLSKKERLENVQGAFRLKNQNNLIVKNQRIIIIDDVWTTGATMRECAKILKQGGASEVWGVTIAR